MRTTWLGSWLRYLLAWVGLVLVLAGWVIATIAGLVATDSATAIRWARARFSSSLSGALFWLRLGAALFLAFLFLFLAFLIVVWFVVAITYPFPPLIVRIDPGFDLVHCCSGSHKDRHLTARSSDPPVGRHSRPGVNRSCFDRPRSICGGESRFSHQERRRLPAGNTRSGTAGLTAEPNWMWHSHIRPVSESINSPGLLAGGRKVWPLRASLTSRPLRASSAIMQSRRPPLFLCYRGPRSGVHERATLSAVAGRV